MSQTKIRQVFPFILLTLVFTLLSCNRQVQIDNIIQQPNVTTADKAFANVYRLLDGKWRGTFYIYEDTARLKKNLNLLYDLTKERLNQHPLKLVNTIEVEQNYSSLSPYFQNVEIKDFEPSSGKTFLSNGVNKIQDGELWCVIKKTDETVIHKGSLPAENVIIWQRNEKSPQRIEYFYETVSQNQYQIIGWGYYEGDDPGLMPKYWFYADYKKEK